jgi:hypothetical protein
MTWQRNTNQLHQHLNLVDVRRREADDSIAVGALRNRIDECPEQGGAVAVAAMDTQAHGLDEHLRLADHLQPVNT